MLYQSEKSKRPAYEVLKQLHSALESQQKIIPFDAEVHFTKGKPGRTAGYILHETELEKEVFNWLESRVSFQDVISRYKQYDKNVSTLEWPTHYATRFINVQSNADSSDNIFMFFPEALGVNTDNIEDYFGFEFIDNWVCIFEEIIFPCMRRVFDKESQLELYSTLRPVLEKTIYLGAVFHEIGHRCGFWKVSPAVDSRIDISKFHTDVLGELATDTMATNFLTEFPEVKYFIFLQRLFWFGRFGFKDDSVKGHLNTDNDTWIGSYLWNQYVQHGVLKQNADQTWHFDFDKLNSVFANILENTDVLGDKVVSSALNEQDELIQSWMENQVPKLDHQFCYPQTMQETLKNCIDIREKPLNKN